MSCFRLLGFTFCVARSGKILLYYNKLCSSLSGCYWLLDIHYHTIGKLSSDTLTPHHFYCHLVWCYKKGSTSHVCKDLEAGIYIEVPFTGECHLKSWDDNNVRPHDPVSLLILDSSKLSEQCEWLPVVCLVCACVCAGVGVYAPGVVCVMKSCRSFLWS